MKTSIRNPRSKIYNKSHIAGHGKTRQNKVTANWLFALKKMYFFIFIQMKQITKVIRSLIKILKQRPPKGPWKALLGAFSN